MVARGSRGSRARVLWIESKGKAPYNGRQEGPGLSAVVRTSSTLSSPISAAARPWWRSALLGFWKGRARDEGQAQPWRKEVTPDPLAERPEWLHRHCVAAVMLFIPVTDQFLIHSLA